MILGVYKPAGITSHDVVAKIRHITGEKRVGHGGTLDPFAEGVLVVAITRDSTKKLHEVLRNTDKEYIAVLELGKKSSTGDTEGILTYSSNSQEFANIDKEAIEKTIKKFRGRIKQTPPAYSAVKVKGVPAYKLARKGQKPALKEKSVEIKELGLLDFSPPELTLRATVSSGTYIRVLAEDIGKELGVGAYTKKLIRTRVGKFNLENSKTLEELREYYTNKN